MIEFIRNVRWLLRFAAEKREVDARRQAAAADPSEPVSFKARILEFRALKAADPAFAKRMDQCVTDLLHCPSLDEIKAEIAEARRHADRLPPENVREFQALDERVGRVEEACERAGRELDSVLGRGAVPSAPNVADVQSRMPVDPTLADRLTGAVETPVSGRDE